MHISLLKKKKSNSLPKILLTLWSLWDFDNKMFKAQENQVILLPPASTGDFEGRKGKNESKHPLVCNFTLGKKDHRICYFSKSDTWGEVADWVTFSKLTVMPA